MKIAKLMIIAATLASATSAFASAPANCPRMKGISHNAPSNAQVAERYAKQINGDAKASERPAAPRPATAVN